MTEPTDTPDRWDSGDALRAAVATLDTLVLHWRKPIGSGLCGPARTLCARELEEGLLELRRALSLTMAEIKHNIWAAMREAHPRQCCADPECMICGMICCPSHEPLHFHHDGCPACFFREGGATA